MPALPERPRSAPAAPRPLGSSLALAILATSLCAGCSLALELPDANDPPCLELVGVSCEVYRDGALGAPTPEADSQFGASVAVAPDILVVGEPGASSGGSVGFFEYGDARWSFVVSYIGEDEPGRNAGTSVDIDGVISVTGSPGQNSGAGAVWINGRNLAGEWFDALPFVYAETNANGPLLPAGSPGDLFGWDVAISVVRIAVGAPGVRVTSEGTTYDRAGAVYLFEYRAEDGTDPAGWYLDGYVVSPTPSTDGLFGISVDLEGDTMVVGAPNEDGSGVVHVFARRAARDWRLHSTLEASNRALDDFFGESVSLSGSLLAVGAPGEGAPGVDRPDDRSAPQAGAVYIYRFAGTSFTEVAYLKATNVDAGDQFGHALALAGTRLAVGAPLEASRAAGLGSGSDAAATDNEAPGAGAVYLFDGSTGTWTQRAYVKADAVDAGDRCGDSVSLFDDRLAFGCPYADSADADDLFDDSLSDTGAVYVRRIGF